MMPVGVQHGLKQVARRCLGLLLLLLFATKISLAAEPWSKVRASVDRRPAVGNRITLAATWQAAPLHTVVQRLVEHAKLAIFVDRRIDPSTPITISSEGDGVSLLSELAQQHGWGVSSLGDVLYLGPRKSARDLRSLHARAKLYSQRLAKPLSKKSALRWDRLAQPRSTIEKRLAAENLRLANPQAVPLDLWPQSQLPAMPLSEQLTLLLVGFDLDWQAQGAESTIRLMPISQPVRLAATHRANRATSNTPEEFAKLAPDARVKVTKGLWNVTARVEDHELLEKLLRGQSPGATAGRAPRASPNGPNGSEPAWANKRFTLTVREKPTGAILGQLARTLGMELIDQTGGVNRSDASANVAELEKPISFEVKQAALSELLKAIAGEAGLDIRVVGKRIVLRRPPRE